MEGIFKLIKPFGRYIKGNTYSSFGGSVKGLYCEEINEKIDFDNNEYFDRVD